MNVLSLCLISLGKVESLLPRIRLSFELGFIRFCYHQISSWYVEINILTIISKPRIENDGTSQFERWEHLRALIYKDELFQMSNHINPLIFQMFLFMLHLFLPLFTAATTDCQILTNWLGKAFLQKCSANIARSCNASPTITYSSIIFSKIPINKPLPADFWLLTSNDIEMTDCGINGTMPEIAQINTSENTLPL